MLERYKCNLSHETLKKAVAELNEPQNNDIRLAEIDKLKHRFQEEADDLELIRTDDLFILRFLRVCKFDQDRALSRLVNYHKKRREWKELFELIDNPRSMQDLLGYGPVVPLRARAKDGTFVTIGRLGHGYRNNNDVLKSIAALALTFEKLLENEEMQIYGVTVIEDMSYLSLSLAMHLASFGRQFVHLVQDAMPVRIKSINMVNEALVFDITFALMRPFMKEKLKNRMQLHGNTFDTLHEKIRCEDLPPCMGGTGPDLDCEWWKEEILSSLGRGEDTAL